MSRWWTLEKSSSFSLWKFNLKESFVYLTLKCTISIDNKVFISSCIEFYLYYVLWEAFKRKSLIEVFNEKFRDFFRLNPSSKDSNIFHRKFLFLRNIFNKFRCFYEWENNLILLGGMIFMVWGLWANAIVVSNLDGSNRGKGACIECGLRGLHYQYDLCFSKLSATMYSSLSQTFPRTLLENAPLRCCLKLAILTLYLVFSTQKIVFFIQKDTLCCLVMKRIDRLPPCCDKILVVRWWLLIGDKLCPASLYIPKCLVQGPVQKRYRCPFYRCPTSTF